MNIRKENCSDIAVRAGSEGFENHVDLYEDKIQRLPDFVLENSKFIARHSAISDIAPPPCAKYCTGEWLAVLFLDCFSDLNALFALLEDNICHTKTCPCMLVTSSEEAFWFEQSSEKFTKPCSVPANTYTYIVLEWIDKLIGDMSCEMTWWSDCIDTPKAEGVVCFHANCYEHRVCQQVEKKKEKKILQSGKEKETTDLIKTTRKSIASRAMEKLFFQGTTQKRLSEEQKADSVNRSVDPIVPNTKAIRPLKNHRDTPHRITNALAFRDAMVKAFTRMLSVYRHVYFHHFEKLVELQAGPSINAIFKHFYNVAILFGLLDFEGSGLEELIRLLSEDGNSSYAPVPPEACSTEAASQELCIEYKKQRNERSTNGVTTLLTPCNERGVTGPMIGTVGNKSAQFTSLTLYRLFERERRKDRLTEDMDKMREVLSDHLVQQTGNHSNGYSRQSHSISEIHRGDKKSIMRHPVQNLTTSTKDSSDYSDRKDGTYLSASPCIDECDHPSNTQDINDRCINVSNLPSKNTRRLGIVDRVMNRRVSLFLRGVRTRLNTNIIKVVGCVGSGQFGKVYKVRFRDGMDENAILSCSGSTLKNKLEHISHKKSGSPIHPSSETVTENIDTVKAPLESETPFKDTRFPGVTGSTDYALKMMAKKRHGSKNNAVNQIILETRALQRSNKTSRVVDIYASFQDSKYVYILTEYAAGGSFDTLMKSQNINMTRLSTAVFYLTDLLLAVEAVHSAGFIHRDIKPENLVVTARGHLRLIDFGLCAKKQEEKLVSCCGTPLYMAPEMHRGSGYTKLCDYWAVGIIFYQMLYTHVPFAKARFMKKGEKVEVVCAEQALRYKEYIKIPSTKVTGINDTLPRRIKSVLLGLIRYESNDNEDWVHESNWNWISKKDAKVLDIPSRLSLKELKTMTLFEGVDWENQHLQTCPLKCYREADGNSSISMDSSDSGYEVSGGNGNSYQAEIDDEMHEILPKHKNDLMVNKDKYMTYSRISVRPDRLPSYDTKHLVETFQDMQSDDEQSEDDVSMIG